MRGLVGWGGGVLCFRIRIIEISSLTCSAFVFALDQCIIVTLSRVRPIQDRLRFGKARKPCQNANMIIFEELDQWNHRKVIPLTSTMAIRRQA